MSCKGVGCESVLAKGQISRDLVECNAFGNFLKGYWYEVDGFWKWRNSEVVRGRQ